MSADRTPIQQDQIVVVANNGLTFEFEATRDQVIHGHPLSKMAFDSILNAIDEGDLKLLDTFDAGIWPLFRRMAEQLATIEDRTRWAALVTSMRLAGRISEANYAAMMVKP